MKFFMCGYYGGQNLGDELLLYKIISDINKIYKDSIFFVWTIDKEFTEEFLKDFNIIAVDRFSATETSAAVFQCDAIVYGGGGLIQEHYGLKVKDIFTEFGEHVPTYSIPALMGNIYHKKVFFWGLGHGPVYTEEGTIFSKWFYNLASVVVLRDSYSFEAVKRFKSDNHIYLDGDPLFDFDFESFAEKNIQKNRIVGINIRPGFLDENTIRDFAESLRIVNERYPDIKFSFIPCDLKLDVEIIKKLKDATVKAGVSDKNIVLRKIETIYDVVRAISECNWFIGMRLHSVIAAYKMNIKLGSISYDIKTEEFAKSLGIDYLRVGDISEGSIFNYINSVINEKCMAVLRKDNFKYETPQIFKKFIENKGNMGKEDKLASYTHDAQEEFLNKNIRYAGNFIETLLFRQDTLEKKLNDKELRVRELEDKNIKLKEEVTNRQSELNKYFKESNSLRDKLNQQIELTKQCLQNEERAKKELRNIYSSNLWKLSRKYYRLKENSVLKYIYPYYKPMIDGLFKKKYYYNDNGVSDVVSDVGEKHEYKENVFEQFIDKKNKIVVLFSSIIFDELLNQRPMNIAKQFSAKGYGVIFVIWQWSKNDKVTDAFKEVYRNVFQIPMYDFFNDIENIRIDRLELKVFYITFPESKILSFERFFREKGFKIVYDIMDDWNGFAEVGQASWYKRDVEEKVLLGADFIFSVNSYLAKKFDFLRRDIKCVGNGYDVESIGEDAKFIAAKDAEKLRIGYVGWLDKGTFDWDFVFKIATTFTNLNIELIGYGLNDEIKERMSKFKNISFVGKVHPSKLKLFVSKWIGGIIPFKEGMISKGADPLKIYQFIYFGLPTLVEGCDDILNYPLVFPCRNIDDVKSFLELFSSQKKVLEYRKKHSEDIERFLDNSTWDSRVKEILNAIERRTLWE